MLSFNKKPVFEENVSHFTPEDILSALIKAASPSLKGRPSLSSDFLQGAEFDKELYAQVYPYSAARTAGIYLLHHLAGESFDEIDKRLSEEPKAEAATKIAERSLANPHTGPMETIRGILVSAHKKLGIKSPAIDSPATTPSEDEPAAKPEQTLEATPEDRVQDKPELSNNDRYLFSLTIGEIKQAVIDSINVSTPFTNEDMKSRSTSLIPALGRNISMFMAYYLVDKPWGEADFVHEQIALAHEKSITTVTTTPVKIKKAISSKDPFTLRILKEAGLRLGLTEDQKKILMPLELWQADPEVDSAPPPQKYTKKRRPALTAAYLHTTKENGNGVTAAPPITKKTVMQAAIDTINDMCNLNPPLKNRGFKKGQRHATFNVCKADLCLRSFYASEHVLPKNRKPSEHQKINN